MFSDSTMSANSRCARHHAVSAESTRSCAEAHTISSCSHHRLCVFSSASSATQSEPTPSVAGDAVDHESSAKYTKVAPPTTLSAPSAR